MQIFMTADGSPTLEFRRDDGYVEKMHHSGGALSESRYIYRQALKMAQEFGPPVGVLSFGLGLGYNELITVAELRRAGVENWTIWSFEAVDFLREEFESWILGQRTSALYDVTETVARTVAAACEIAPDKLKKYISEALATGHLRLQGPFPECKRDCSSINAVYYDAYSKKMNPELWTEDYIVQSLKPVLANQCVIATYAATGTLNRALKELGFRLLDKPGFLGKRESTLAIRLPL
jgi:tRNA U34 5-methylaminomethyl-2-thiouridine-forming methyltransferase MnmC